MTTRRRQSTETSNGREPKKDGHTVRSDKHERRQNLVGRDVVQGRNRVDEIKVVRVVRIAIVGGPGAA